MKNPPVPEIPFNSNVVQVLCTGTFNVVHAGHVELFEFASQFGVVTVGVNNDPYLREKYGDRAVPLLHRTYVLRANRFIDDVVMFPEDDPSELIRKLRPKYFIRGPDYNRTVLPEQAALDEVGATLIIHQTEKIYSSTKLVKDDSVLKYIKDWF